MAHGECLLRSPRWGLSLPRGAALPRPQRGWGLGPTHGSSRNHIPTPRPPSPQWHTPFPSSPQPPQGAAGGVRDLTSLSSIGLLGEIIQEFAAAMQGVVAAGVVSALPSPSQSTPMVKVSCYISASPILCVRCGGRNKLPTIWDAMTQGKGKTEGLATLKQALMRDLTSFRKVFGGREHFSASLPLLYLVLNVINRQWSNN